MMLFCIAIISICQYGAGSATEVAANPPRTPRQEHRCDLSQPVSNNIGERCYEDAMKLQRKYPDMTIIDQHWDQR